jgi:hypothetical protein
MVKAGYFGRYSFTTSVRLTLHPVAQGPLWLRMETATSASRIGSSVPEGDVVGDIDIRLGQIKHPAPVSIVGAPSPQPSLPPSNIVGLSSHVRDVASRIDILFH